MFINNILYNNYMSILELKSIQELKSTNSHLSNQQLTGISEQIVDRQDNDPLFKATVPEFLFRPPFGTPRNIHAPFLREISKNPYIFSIIKTLQDEAASTEWDIVVKEGFEVTPEDEKNRQFIKDFFTNPNSDNESFSHLIRKLIWDISVLDSGVIVKVYNKLQELLQIRVIDGASINKNPDQYGSLNQRADYVPLNIFQVAQSDTTSAYKQLETQFRNQFDTIAAYYQFSTTVMNSTPIPFGKKEIIYIMQHPNSAGVYSVTSPVQASVDVVLSLIFGAKYHLDYFMNGNGPEGIISLPGANQVVTDAFKQKLNATIMTGRDQFGIQRRVGHRLPVVGNENVNFTPLTFPSKDMEIIEQQQWFTKILWMQFGVTPSEMGFTEDASKNVDVNQTKVAAKRGIKPILENIAHHLNTQVIPELDDKNMFEFKWDEYDMDEDIKKRTLQEQEIRMGIKSWQIIAEEEGLDINRLQKDKEANQEFEFSAMEGDDDGNNFGKDKEEPKKEEPKKEDKKKVEEKSTTTDSGGEGISDTPLVPVETKPFAGYSNFQDCVNKNRDKKDPEAYCGAIKQQVEGKSDSPLKTPKKTALEVTMDEYNKEFTSLVKYVINKS